MFNFSYKLFFYIFLIIMVFEALISIRCRSCEQPEEEALDNGPLLNEIDEPIQSIDGSSSHMDRATPTTNSRVFMGSDRSSVENPFPSNVTLLTEQGLPSPPLHYPTPEQQRQNRQYQCPLSQEKGD